MFIVGILVGLILGIVVTVIAGVCMAAAKSDITLEQYYGERDGNGNT